MLYSCTSMRRPDTVPHRISKTGRQRQEAPKMPDVTNNLTALSKGVTDLARDTAYVAVGLGVLAYQRAQVQRVELQNRLSHDFSLDQRIGEVRQGVAKGINQIDDFAETAVQF